MRVKVRDNFGSYSSGVLHIFVEACWLGEAAQPVALPGDPPVSTPPQELGLPVYNTVPSTVHMGLSFGHRTQAFMFARQTLDLLCHFPGPWIPY